MLEITRAAIVRVGVDVAKQVIQTHAVDAAGRRVVARAIERDQFLARCAQLPPGCLVAMETCGAHHWARQLIAMGLDARLIAAGFVTPYRMQGAGGKNDANDAPRAGEVAGAARAAEPAPTARGSSPDKGRSEDGLCLARGPALRGQGALP